jgi:hypothetical protein
VGPIDWPRASFEMRAATCSFFVGYFASQLKHRVGNFGSNETPKILPDRSQYVGNFLIGSRHYCVPWIEFCRPRRKRTAICPKAVLIKVAR